MVALKCSSNGEDKMGGAVSLLLKTNNCGQEALTQCWLNHVNVGPTLSQHWVNASWLVGCHRMIFSYIDLLVLPGDVDNTETVEQLDCNRTPSIESSQLSALYSSQQEMPTAIQ